MARARLGITVPFEGVSLRDQLRWFGELEDAGYTDFWTAESDGLDAFVPAAAAATATRAARIGTGIAPVFTRGPATLAQTAQATAELAPGRFVLGIGASSEAIVKRWNGIPFEQPFARTRDTLRFLRKALAGERVSESYETFSIEGFALRRSPELLERPPIFLAALRPRMISLAVREADGVITNWLRAEDLRKVRQEVDAAAEIAGKPKPELVCRVFVIPSEDLQVARGLGAYLLNAYINVAAYRDFHRWLGNEELLGPTWRAWEAGDRKAALASLPPEFVDAVMIHGGTEQVAQAVASYVEAGADTVIVALVASGASQKGFALHLGSALSREGLLG
jgi:probable F420-dependent oxidoreductase